MYFAETDQSCKQDDEIRPYNAVLTLEDKPGELRKALSVIGVTNSTKIIV